MLLPLYLVCSFLLLTAGLALGQLAPAGGGSVQVAPGEYFTFGSEGMFAYGSGFTYINRLPWSPVPIPPLFQARTARPELDSWKFLALAHRGALAAR